jgi:hypothetical protein
MGSAAGCLVIGTAAGAGAGAGTGAAARRRGAAADLGGLFAAGLTSLSFAAAFAGLLRAAVPVVFAALFRVAIGSSVIVLAAPQG